MTKEEITALRGMLERLQIEVVKQLREISENLKKISEILEEEKKRGL